MKYYGDYHTHSVYSHGKQTIAESRAAADALELAEFAVTDHGLKHIVFGLRPAKVDRMRAEIAALNKSAGARVLVGVEANLRGLDGEVDLEEAHYDLFDVVVCNFHKCVYPADFASACKLFVPNVFGSTFRLSPTDAMVRRNTRALVRMVERHPIHILSHISHDMPVDCREVAKACADYGTLVELSGKKQSFSDEEFLAMADAGATFVLDSDAHSASRVGDFALAEALLARTGYPREKIANYGKRPAFRTK